MILPLTKAKATKQVTLRPLEKKGWLGEGSFLKVEKSFFYGIIIVKLVSNSVK